METRVIVCPGDKLIARWVTSRLYLHETVLPVILRMVDDLHRLVKAADLATPFILIGSELGTLNGRFYSHIHDT